MDFPSRKNVTSKNADPHAAAPAAGLGLGEALQRVEREDGGGVAAPAQESRRDDGSARQQHRHAPNRAHAEYREGGYQVVPIIPPGAELSPNTSIQRDDVGKIPGRRGQHGWAGFNWLEQSKAPKPRALERWTETGAGVGFVCGEPGGVVGIDIDVLDEEAAEKVQQVAEQTLGGAPVRVGLWPKRLLVYGVDVLSEPVQTAKVAFRSGAEGTHKHLVEIRGQGQQFVAQGIHPNTRQPYTWDRPVPPRDDLVQVDAQQVQELTDALVEALEEAGWEVQRGGGKGRSAAARAKIDQDALAADDLDMMDEAVAYIRNTTARFPDRDAYIRMANAFRAAYRDDPERGERAWLDWCARWEDPDGRENDPDKASGDYWRCRPPHELGAPYLFELARDGGYNDAPRVFTDAPPEQSGAAELRQVQIAKRQFGRPPTDAGNAERLYDNFGDRLRYCYDLGRWLRWSDQAGRWVWCNAQQEELDALECVRAIPVEATWTDDESRRTQLLKHAASSENHARIRAMVRSAQPLLPVSIQQLDAQPWLLPVRNGTLDLRTGELREHRVEDFLTKQLGIDFDPSAKAPTFQAFLERVQPDEEIRRFLQRAAGVTLIGEPVEQVLLFNHGRGANGKTSFLEALANVLGPFTERLPAEALMVKGDQQRDQHIANLHGARMAIASEVPEGQHLAEALVKDLTGGDTLTGKVVYQPPFSFRPSHTLWLFGNHRPTISGGDHGIWRRIMLVPWEEVISDDERDPRLAEKLRDEKEGILAWMVRGALDYARTGNLNPPKRVRAAVDDYRLEMDTVKQFLDERTVFDPEATTPAGDLQSAYEDFCRTNGYRPKLGRGFAEALKRHGLEARRTKTGRFWAGVRLGPPPGLGVVEADDLGEADPLAGY
ncbi:MAG: phage/plasmid primase, P4 family [Halorhodospira halophila]|uniref:phage/plasmid primase, P4 family n=1 Tax=Halorhodospira halophila TaxID=1053 RepID=UPI0026F08C84|nr:phage/plasmid primase, P4 family [Halorhodospira halophila]MCC3751769.1 phage/plasmid primase, P4 family [Halorhodospira halophila]